MVSSVILPHRRYRFRFVAERAIPLPPYKGSAFRGVFGHALRRVICPAARELTCAPCPLAGACLYLLLFETPASGRMHRPGPNRDPHPFLLLPPLTREPLLPAGAPFDLEMTLLTPLAGTIPHIILACQEMGRIGLGRNNLPFHLMAVDKAHPTHGWTPFYRRERGQLLPLPPQAEEGTQEAPAPPAPGAPLTLRTLTPLRMVENGRMVRRFSFPLYLRALLFRLDDLTRVYWNHPLPAAIPDLLRRADAIRVTVDHMRWVEYTRYSNRQQAARKLGGLEGSVQLVGDLAPFWPWMIQGQWLHVGKSTSFGLGGYRLEWPGGGCCQ